MGYFSDLSIDHKTTSEEPSWSLYQRALMDRLDDLELQRENLTLYGSREKESWGLRDEDLRYVLPHDLQVVEDVDRAALIAEGDLWKSLGIHWGLYANEIEEPEAPKPFVVPGQITIFEHLHDTVRVA